MKNEQLNHISVLKEEIISYLDIQYNGIYIDCTLGAGGHSHEILKRLNGTGYLYGIDQDKYACDLSYNFLKRYHNNFKIINTNYSNIKKIVKDNNLKKINGIIFDLGFSSMQIDDPNRGFSYKKNSILDMRMDTKSKILAKDVVNNYSLQELSYIFRNYGEERFYKRIANNIIKYRNLKPIEKTFELVNLIKRSLPYNYRTSKHPAKKVFQALRIEVNKELFHFEKALDDAISILSSKGRLCVITFHSLEDRICKKKFNYYSKNQGPSNYLEKLLIDPEKNISSKIINKKPLSPSSDEILQNPRSKSAKLRVLEKL